MPIIVYNRNNEDHTGDKNNYPIYRPNVLSNPYTHISDRQTSALYVVKDRDEAIDAYAHYFDVMYGGNIEFKKAVDEIYEKYRNGETVYLECFCKPLRCHGDIIASKLKQRLLKESVRKAILENKCQKETKQNTAL